MSDRILSHGYVMRDFVRALTIAKESDTYITLIPDEYSFLLSTLRAFWDVLKLSDPIATAALIAKYSQFFSKV